MKISASWPTKSSTLTSEGWVHLLSNDFDGIKIDKRNKLNNYIQSRYLILNHYSIPVIGQYRYMRDHVKAYESPA